jgi:hypothetical protein
MGEKGTKGWAMIKSESWRSLQTHDWQGAVDQELHNPVTGQKAVWDDERGQWVESAGGQPLTADPNAAT